MSRPRLILLKDDQAILEMGENVSAEEVETIQTVWAEAMRNKATPIILAGEQGWEIVDKRQPDIEARLEKAERWIKNHRYVLHERRRRGFSPAVDGIDYDSSEQ